MNEFPKNLYRELSEDLVLIHDMGDVPVKRPTTALRAVTLALSELADDLPAPILCPEGSSC